MISKCDMTIDTFPVTPTNQEIHRYWAYMLRHPQHLPKLVFCALPSDERLYLKWAIIQAWDVFHPEHITADQFLENLVVSIRSGYPSDFTKYMNSSVLLIDDIHQFSGKWSCQQELYNLIKARFEADMATILLSEYTLEALSNGAFTDELVHLLRLGRSET